MRDQNKNPLDWGAIHHRIEMTAISLLFILGGIIPLIGQ